jgi:hypothetical protein
MHCPKCGTLIESEEVRFCSRCGLTLGGVRAAIAVEAGAGTEIEVSVGGVNIGVGIMFVLMLPALFAVLTSPIALPAAFLFLAVAYIALLLGSGQLLKFFHTNDTPASDEAIRVRRKEIAFGSTLMFVGTILATLLVTAGVPDRWVPIALVALLSGTFGGLLLSSRWLFRSFRELTLSVDPRELPGRARTPELAAGGLATGDLDAGASSFTSDKRRFEYAEKPPSVTEGTTRLLEKDADRSADD